MIKFKVIPVLNDKFLIQTIDDFDTFLSIDLKDIDYEKCLKNQLQKLFNVEFLIGRSFQVLNKKNDILIYTFVHPKAEFEIAGFNWKSKEELDPKRFNKFNEVVINNILANF